MFGAEFLIVNFLVQQEAARAREQMEAQRQRSEAMMKAYRDRDVIDVESRVITDPLHLGNSL